MPLVIILFHLIDKNPIEIAHLRLTEGQIPMKLFNQFRYLKKKPYWGNHFWAKGYYVDKVGLDADMIRRYVRYQEKQERQVEQLQLFDQ
jgi:putative transposase